MNMACVCFLLIDTSYPICPQLREISNLIHAIKKLSIDRGKGIGLYYSSLVEFLKPLLYSGDNLFHAFEALFLEH